MDFPTVSSQDTRKVTPQAEIKSDDSVATIIKIVLIACVFLFAAAQLSMGAPLVPLLLLGGTGTVIILGGGRVYRYFVSNSHIFVPSPSVWTPRHSVVVDTPTVFYTPIPPRNPAADNIQFNVPGQSNVAVGGGHTVPVVPVQQAYPAAPTRPAPAPIIYPQSVQQPAQVLPKQNPAARQVQFNIPGATNVAVGGGHTVPVVPVQQAAPAPQPIFQQQQQTHVGVGSRAPSHK